MYKYKYVFLCTKNFQPKNKYAILSIIAQLSSVYVIITAFIYCSASVFCCIFFALFFGDNGDCCGNGGYDDGGGSNDDDGQKQEDKFLCTISLLLCVAAAFDTLRFIIYYCS